MQEDRHLGFDLYGAFRSILLPVIERGGGCDIEFTGDDVSARFADCQSAIRTCFEIHQALDRWNSSRAWPRLTVRSGIHVSSPGDQGHQHGVSLVVADHLQSLGRADAICVSSPVIESLAAGVPDYVCPLGEHALGAQALGDKLSTSPVYYLFNEDPGFISRLKLRIDRVKKRYLKTPEPVFAVTVLLILILIASGSFSMRNENKVIVIDIPQVKDFSTEKNQIETNRISHFLRSRLNSLAGVKIHSASDQSKFDFQVIVSFQHISDQVRLTWGFYRLSDKLQISGGDVTGSRENLAKLENQLLQCIATYLQGR